MEERLKIVDGVLQGGGGFPVVRRGGALPLLRATARVAPTVCLPIGFRRGRCPHRPAPVTRGAVRGRNPPVTASPCQPPLGKGAQGTGDADCHTSDIGHWFAMTHYKKCGVNPDGRTEASAPTECNKRCNGRATARVAPTEALQEVRCKPGRADRGVRPYGSVTRGAMGGRPQGSPLRIT